LGVGIGVAASGEAIGAFYRGQEEGSGSGGGRPVVIVGASVASAISEGEQRGHTNLMEGKSRRHRGSSVSMRRRWPEASGRGGALPAAAGGGDCGILWMTSFGPRWASMASRARG
jgi:hypothetical protein